MLEIKKILKEHFTIFIIIFLIYALGVYLVSEKPLFQEVKELEKTGTLFGLSMNATIILLWISFYLLYRWNKTNRKNLTNFIWGISFLLYSIVFIGMMLEAFGVEWANSKRPEIFFMFREFQILWAAGMYLGISKILTKSRILQFLPTILILILGYSWFYHGLLNVKDIEYTMYGFLYGIWIPLCVFLGYLFFLYSKRSKLIAPKYIALGFIAIAFTYTYWAPWHLTKFYLICFFTYILALIPLLIGFLLIPYESKAKGIE
ncbi:MAG: hypothetical protein QW802_03900 [Candidatus Altiarchaeota archaeon]